MSGQISLLDDQSAIKDADRSFVVVQDLVKSYKKSKHASDKLALDRLSFEVKAGELYGIIGPDGAGKSTCLAIMAGVMRSDGGRVMIGGKEPAQCKRSIGYVPQGCGLYPELSIDESFAYEAGLRGVSKKELESFKEQYLPPIGLDGIGHRLTTELSGGMRQNLALALALLSKPDVVLLDEPTCGLDPLARRELWKHFKELSKNGTTTIISTPFLEEAAHCDRVLLIYEGHAEKQGPPRQMADSLDLRRYVVTGDKIAELTTHQIDQVRESDSVIDANLFGDHIEILMGKGDGKNSPQDLLVDLKHRFADEALNLDIQETPPTVENVFVLSLRDKGLQGHDAEVFKRVGEKNQKNIEGQKNKQSALKAQNLVKQFGAFRAVDDISLDLAYGEIYGLLGANGAGKTTTIKMLSGLLQPSSGSVELMGEKSSLRSKSLRHRIGYMSQKFTLYDGLTVIQNLKFYAGVYDIDRGLRNERVEWAIDACGLADIAHSQVAALPLGFKQRIAFGAAVMHDPEIIFLDEPTAGVDPIARRMLWRLIRQFAQRGACILVTTHYMDEAEYCNRLCFMTRARMVAEGSPHELKSKSGKKDLEEAFVKYVEDAANEH